MSKIRTGFVSNSSSSSFCIYGTHLNREATIEILRDQHNILIDDIDELEDIISLNVYYMPYDDDGFYIGRSFKTIKDNETGKAFKENVEEKIKKYFPNSSLRTIEEAFYDG